MFGPVADQQILRATAGTLSFQYLDSAGEPADPGVVTIGVIRADGTVVQAPGGATVGSGVAPRTFALTAVQTAALDLLTATWTRSSDSTTYVTKAEVVGGYYATVAQIRASDPILGDIDKYPTADLQAQRAEIEQAVEEITEVSFVPRYQREALNGTGTHTLFLPRAMPRRIVAVSEIDSDGNVTAWTGSEVAAIRLGPTRTIVSQLRTFPCGAGNIVVAWEHGYDRPPTEVRDKALLLQRYRAVRPNTSIPARATSFQIDGGTVYRLDTAGRKRTGIPDIDAVLDRWSMAYGGVA